MRRVADTSSMADLFEREPARRRSQQNRGNPDEHRRPDERRDAGHAVAVQQDSDREPRECRGETAPRVNEADRTRAYPRRLQFSLVAMVG